MKFVPLTPDDVVRQWGWLRHGILHCINKTREKFLPEDVYCALRGNVAWAFVFRTEEDEDFGFMVLQNQHDPDGVVLFVWALWCEANAGAKHKDAIYAELEKLAVAAKVKRIRMQSPRPGWGRETFFEQVAVVYERQISEVT